MKKIAVLILVFMFFIGCSDELVNTPPEISIQVGETEIKYIVGLSSWGGVDYDREDTFTVLIDNYYKSIPNIKLLSKIKINMDEKIVPETMVLHEYVLDEDGNYKYADRVIPFKMNDGTGSFILDTQVVKLFSSNSLDEVPSETVRGFKLICKWGKNECEYAFIIRTDAP